MLLRALGFCQRVSDVLLKVKYKQLSARNRVVGLQFDEVHIKKDLSYDNQEDKFVGK